MRRGDEFGTVAVATPAMTLIAFIESSRGFEAL